MYSLRTKITWWFLGFFLVLFSKNIEKFKRWFLIFKIFPIFLFSQNSILIFHNIIRIQRIINPCLNLCYMYSIHVCASSSPIWVHAVALCTLTSMSCHVYPTVLLLVKIKSLFSSPVLPAGPSQLRENEAVGYQFIHHHQQYTCQDQNLTMVDGRGKRRQLDFH